MSQLPEPNPLTCLLGVLVPWRENSKTMNENEIGREIVDAAVKIHRALGPGLLESVYEAILAHELARRGLQVQRQVPVPIVYEGVRFEEGFRADLIVNGLALIELKSVENLNNAHRKQTLTYLRLTGIKLGFLLNFSQALMKDGIERIVNQLPETDQATSPG